MYIALDMGTSNTRLWLCDDECVVDSTKMEMGASAGKTNGKEFLFENLKKQIENLLKNANLTAKDIECIIASGMAGSEMGLKEIPHIALPADISDLSEHLQSHKIPEITEIPFLFVPGLKKTVGDKVEDIMRGEEVETVGVLSSLSSHKDITIVLPGTHNKTISVTAEGSITDFCTTSSGEMLNGIINHSILSGQVSHQFTLDESYLRKGAAFGIKKGLGAALFHIRVMALNGTDADKLSSFLYGCVIGQDIQQILCKAAGETIYVGGRENLREAYRVLLGEGAIALGSDISAFAVQRGLSAIYKLHRTQSKREKVLSRLATEKIVAIVRGPEKETFIPAMKALYDGGIRLAEITFDRSGKIPKEQTAHLIRLLKETLPMYVGAGTVTNEEEVWLAYKAGASFIISPDSNPRVIQLTRRLGMVSIPGAYTPTEITAAIGAGADYIKLFPCDGVSKEYVKAISAPLSDAKLLAVGGITEKNVGEFLQNGFYGVGVGSNLYNKSLIDKGDFAALKDLAKAFVTAIK